MSAVLMMVLGAGAGLGLVATARSLQPSPTPIAEVFAATEGRGEPYRAEAQVRTARQVVRLRLERFGSRLAVALADEDRLRADLAVTGSSLEQHAIEKTVGPALVLVVGCAGWAGLPLVGVMSIGPWPALVVLGVAGVAFIVPDVRLRSRAAARRTSFRHALSAYLDLVTMILAGGGGLLTALHVAADSGAGWAFAELRGALDRARLAGRPPWHSLRQLADQIDVVELRDLTAAIELAGSEGSRMIASVETRADVLRSRIQSEAEASAESLTEQMLLPVGLVLVALFMFIGFAIFSQLSGSSPGELVGLSVTHVLRWS